MKRTTFALLLGLLLSADANAKVTTEWQGLVSFRQRHETEKEYYDYAVGDLTRRGKLLYTTDNSTTRLGYQFGIKFLVNDDLFAGITLRSGLSGGALVLQQDITSREGLLPGLQEAYIHWDSPFALIELGKMPQAGNAMWDVYVASLQTDFRMDDPRDGVFNDRMAALNGVRVSRSVAFATLRALFHADYTAGNYRKFEEGGRDFQRTPDRNVVVIGTTLDLGDQSLAQAPGYDLFRGLVLDFDYGFPKRAAKTGTNVDSLYADETFWGAGLKESFRGAILQISYGYNWRDSVFTMSYWDVLGQVKFTDMIDIQEVKSRLGDLRLSIGYQLANQELEYDPYKNAMVERSACHIYLNRTVAGLDIQPRVIFFDKRIEGFKQRRVTRYEVTGTVRF